MPFGFHLTSIGAPLPHLPQVGRKIALQKFRRSVVLCVVDVAGGRRSCCCVGQRRLWLLCDLLPCRVSAAPCCLPVDPAQTGCCSEHTPCCPHAIADFDGSLPRAALRSILPEDLRAPSARNDGTGERPLPLGFRLIVAVNKADLLPKQVTPARLEVRKMR